MILLAKPFVGYLDISGPEVLDIAPFENWLGRAAQFRRSVRTGDIIEVPDEYLRFPNIKNAVGLGLLEVVSYDSSDESIVINAELAGLGATGAPGDKYVFFDLHGGVDSVEVKVVNSTPYLIYADGTCDRAHWTLTVPEDYQAGTDIAVEVFWSAGATGTSNVRWLLDYKSMSPGDDSTAAATRVTYDQAASGSIGRLQTTGASLTIPAAILVPGKMLSVAILRDGVADAFSGHVRVHLVRVTYTGLVFS